MKFLLQRHGFFAFFGNFLYLTPSNVLGLLFWTLFKVSLGSEIS